MTRALTSTLFRTWSVRVFILFLGCLAVGKAHAIPVLQLGPGNTGDWFYDGSMDEETWVTTSSTFEMNAYVNNRTFSQSGGWTYLVLGATTNDNDPELMGDLFDVTVENTSTPETDSQGDEINPLLLLTSGYGNPPLEDDNSLPGHGIYPSYFEIYEFRFNGAFDENIEDIQPGQTGTGPGYSESLGITINSLSTAALGVHFDLFTVSTGRYRVDGNDNRRLVSAFSPGSHDAEYISPIPVPAAFWLLGTALIGFIGISRRRTI